MTFKTSSKETAFRRDMLFAVELLDPVTLAPVSEGLRVTASGIVGKPFINASGNFVWLGENTTPQRVYVDPLDLPYEAESRPAPQPPARLLRIILRPKPGYSVGGGVTAVSASVYRTAPGPNGPVGVAGAEVWLEYLDASGGPAGSWLEGLPPHSLTAANGDFVALLRLPVGSRPRLDNGQLRSRLRIGLGADPRFTSPEFLLPQGRKSDLAPFEWDPS